MPSRQLISIVMPVLNEAGELPETLRRAWAVPEVREIIVVDGGSRDETPRLAAAAGCQVMTSPPSRGRQMRVGARRASGELVLFLHADTWLPPNGGQAMRACLRQPGVVAGGFWKVFREPPWLMAGARWKCALRLHLRGRIFGDQAMFVPRHTLEAIGGVPDMPLMEDVELCRRLRQVGRLALAAATVTTSARRFQQHGVLRGYWRMWRVNVLYRLGVPPDRLRAVYEGEKRGSEE